MSQVSSAFDRNKDPILKVLKNLIPNDERLNILEIASGYCNHLRYFSQHFPNVSWYPSDINESLINILTKEIPKWSEISNIQKPIIINASNDANQWLPNDKIGVFDFLVCINMVHISEWISTQGLIKGANYYLKSGGLLIIYGPFIVNGDFIHNNNVNFDKSLRQDNPNWGLRDISEMISESSANNLSFIQLIDMPANNKILLFKKN